MLHEYGKPLKSLTQIKLTSHIELKWRIGNKLKLSILGMSHTILRHTQVNFAACNVGFSNQELSQEFQLDNFGECLNRAKIAKIVRLENNNISTLNSILKGIASSLPEHDAFKGGPDESHFIFKKSVGESWIRHRTNLNFRWR